MKTPRTIELTLCGPGDVAKEIELAKEVIHEWNEKNFDLLNCGVRARHWLSDAVPSMRARGQEVINWELIDTADLVVAIFWQRLGSPTGLHDSGTAEEVNREWPLAAPNRGNSQCPDDAPFSDFGCLRVRMLSTQLGWMRPHIYLRNTTPTASAVRDGEDPRCVTKSWLRSVRT